jgi:hypothetical protein
MNPLSFLGGGLLGGGLLGGPTPGGAGMGGGLLGLLGAGGGSKEMDLLRQILSGGLGGQPRQVGLLGGNLPGMVNGAKARNF